MFTNNILILDLSSQQLINLPDLKRPKVIQSLNLSSNRIGPTADFRSLASLRVLNLSGNFLRQVLDLSALVRLENLDLSNNSLSCLAGVEPLSSLRTLTAAGNDVASLKGVEMLSRLEVLDLSGNALRVEAFESTSLRGLTALRFVDLSSNRITRLDALCRSLPRTLDALLLDGNHVITVTSLYPLSTFGQLQALSIARNPCAIQIQEHHLFSFLVFLLPSLKAIDKRPVEDPIKWDGFRLFKKSQSSAASDLDDEMMSVIAAEEE